MIKIYLALSLWICIFTGTFAAQAMNYEWHPSIKQVTQKKLESKVEGLSGKKRNAALKKLEKAHLAKLERSRAWKKKAKIADPGYRVKINESKREWNKNRTPEQRDRDTKRGSRWMAQKIANDPEFYVKREARMSDEQKEKNKACDRKYQAKKRAREREELNKTLEEAFGSPESDKEPRPKRRRLNSEDTPNYRLAA